MAVWVDPFTGRPVDTDVAPLGGPYPAIPGGTGIYQGDPSDMGGNINTIPITPGGGTPTLTGDLTFTGGYSFQPDRGAVFYFPGDEWRIISSYGDIANLQAALEAAGLLDNGYIVGVPDAKTAGAMKKVLEAANASGLAWQDVLRVGLDAATSAAKSRGGGGGGGGGGVAAVTDEDITALANDTARSVIGRKLNDNEIASFIPAFRGALGSGTSPSVSAENLIRHDIAPQGEADAHQVGNVMDTISKLLGG